MKLLFQSDDYGITDAVACGIIKGIKSGIIRNTGLFVNMPSSKAAANKIKKFSDISVGIDFNIVAGKPISNPEKIPGLVDEKGDFLSSKFYLEQLNGNPMNMEIETDGFIYEEVYLELENQLLKFIELLDRKPSYLHPHSIFTPTIYAVMKKLSVKYDIPVSADFLNEKNFYHIKSHWTPRPFSIEKQLQTDVESALLEELKKALDYERVCFVCHCGFIEEELFKLTSYTIIRIKDLYAAISPKIKAFIEENNIKLITYDDLRNEI